MNEGTIPISEIFTSPQGEGLHAGALMTFIRTAGCSVGKPFPKERYQPDETETDLGGRPKPGLPIYTEQCTTWDGRKFECDTDFRVKERLTPVQILDRVHHGGRRGRICITGGEPLIHNLSPLIKEAFERGIRVHMETSGTIALPKDIEWLYLKHSMNYLWITVSPKAGVLPDMLERADEIKLLVDANFEPDKLPQNILKHPYVYIQPINYENDISRSNLKLCLEIQERFPDWRISTQLHKVWGVR